MKKYILIAVITLIFCLMLVGDGLGVVVFMEKNHTTSQNTGSSYRSEKKVTHPISKDILINIRKFVITVPASPNGNYPQFYLQVSITLETNNHRAEKDFDKLGPIVRSMIITDVMMSGPKLHSNAVELKKLISSSALNASNQVVTKMDPHVGKKPFFGAYVTSYINQ